ncbi:MAG: hypothetical protein WCK23_03740 [Actinomycetes bacterium]
MVYILLAVVIICVVVFAGLATSRRTPTSNDSVADFQRHLNALSPEARRHTVENYPVVTSPTEETEEPNHGT